MKQIRIPFKILFGLIIPFLFSACEKDDDNLSGNKQFEVSFDVMEGNLYAEMEIGFTATSSEELSYYLWYFGDEETGAGKEVGHVYEAEGSYKVTLAAGNHRDSLMTLEQTIEVLPSPFTKHCGDIEGEEVWGEGMHLVTCDVTVNGTLTIQPGAEVYLEENDMIEVNGTLKAQGTADKPIQFVPASSSTSPGSWGYILFNSSASSESVLDFCEIFYGGKADSYDYPAFEYYSSYGMIHLEECSVAINNTTIKGAANYGISLSEGAGFASFENNTFTGNTNHPVKIHAEGVHTLSNTSSFEGEKDILIDGDEYCNPGTDVTWYKQDVPYLIDGSIGLYHGPKLRIEAGTTIKLGSNGAINSGYFNAKNGSITAIGTSAEPITFTSGKDTKGRGDWAGLMVGDSSHIEYCVIEYTGADYTISGYNRALQIVDSTAVVKNCTIRESSGYGIEMEGTGGQISNNTIQDCSRYGVIVNVKDYQVIDKTNLLENTGGFCISTGSGFIEDLTLEKRSYPYVLHYGFYAYNNSTLTIEAGTEIQLRTGSSIVLGYNYVSNSYAGNIIANGTAEEPVVFSLYAKDKDEGNGNWAGIVFGEESASSILNYCILTDGGYVEDGSSYPDMGMIHCYKTNNFPTVTNCTIKNSAGYGITLDQSTIQSSGNSFENNASGNEYSY